MSPFDAAIFVLETIGCIALILAGFCAGFVVLKIAFKNPRIVYTIGFFAMWLGGGLALFLIQNWLHRGAL